MFLNNFGLKSPVQAFYRVLDQHIAKLISTEFPELRCRRLCGVPVSAIVPDSIRRAGLNPLNGKRHLANGHRSGKISLLLVDRDYYTPLAAILISSTVEDERTNAASIEILQECRLPCFVLNESNYKEKLHTLLSWCVNQSSADANVKPAANFTETVFTKELSTFLAAVGLNKYIRPIIQVGTSEVINSFSIFDEYRQPIGAHEIPKSIEEYVALEVSAHGRRIQHLVLKRFLSQSSFDMVVLSEQSSEVSSIQHENVPQPVWWPALAIELDGKTHKEAAGVYRDFKKDQLCIESGLPLLRIDLTKVEPGLFLSHRPGVWRDEATMQAQKELIAFLRAKCRKGYSSHLKFLRQRERAQEVALQTKALMDTGMEFSEAYEQARDSDAVVNQEDDQDEMIELDIDQRNNEEHRTYWRDTYVKQFGTLPDLKVSIDSKGILQGRLGNFSLPPLKPFCTLVGEFDMVALRLEFAEMYLFRRTVPSCFAQTKS